MLKMLHALDAHRGTEPAGELAFRSAHLVGTVRRCLALVESTDPHRDMWLSAAIADYERRWSSSAVIGGRFDLFRRDTRWLIATIGRWLEDADEASTRAA